VKPSAEKKSLSSPTPEPPNNLKPAEAKQGAASFDKPSAQNHDNVARPHDTAKTERARGRQAETPVQIPPKGWLDILVRTNRQLSEDNLSIVAAGVAYYTFLAVVPALAALIGIYALVTDANNIAEHLAVLWRTLPREVMPLLDEQIKRIAADDHRAGWSTIIGLALALFGSSKAITALITGLNITYDEQERRGFFKLQGLSLLFTLIGIVGAAAVIALLALLPSMLDRLPMSAGLSTALGWLRWPVLLGLFVISLSALYRFAPCRRAAKWSWASPGAVTASVFWVIGSALFSIYVSKFGGYDKTYGSLGAVVVFLLWLYLSAYVILLGAELNAEMERQTLKDTTEGNPKPLGQRDAYAADTVGVSRRESPKKS
jgi:membrane protein